MADRSGCGTLYPKEISQQAAIDLFASYGGSGAATARWDFFTRKRTQSSLVLTTVAETHGQKSFPTWLPASFDSGKALAHTFGGRRQQRKVHFLNRPGATAGALYWQPALATKPWRYYESQEKSSVL